MTQTIVTKKTKGRGRPRITRQMQIHGDTDYVDTNGNVWLTGRTYDIKSAEILSVAYKAIAQGLTVTISTPNSNQ